MTDIAALFDSLAQAGNKGTYIFRKSMWQECGWCGGSGLGGRKSHVCRNCGGSGFVRREYIDPLEAVGPVLADAYEIEYLRHTINAWWLHKEPGNIKLLVNFLLDACLHVGWLPASEPTP
jgi:hypothetical protein